MSLPNRGNRVRGVSTARHRRGGLWRLLTCTEGHADDDGDNQRCHSDDELRRRARRTERNRKKLQKAAGKSSHRRAPQGYCGSTNERKSSCSSGISTLDKTSRSYRRNHRRHHRGRRSSVRSKTSDCRFSALKKLQSKSAHENRKQGKRLVVAMLEAGDHDGATESTLSGCDDNRKMLRMRTTRDERKIRRILHQLSTTISTTDDHLPEFSGTLRQSNSTAAPTTVHGTARTHTMTMLPSPLMQQTLSPQQPPIAQAPTPSPRMRPSLLPISVTVDAVSVQPIQQPNASLPNKPSYGVQHFPQSLQAGLDLAQGKGRHGYRLFRRVFSAADNYYAVPFSPLDTIKLSKDDDQWEDLEIHVASHKGTETIKPKAPQPQKRSTVPPKDRLNAAPIGNVSDAPNRHKAAAPAAPSSAMPHPRLATAVNPLEMREKPQQSKGAAPAKAAIAGGDHQPGKLAPQRTFLRQPPRPRQPPASQVTLPHVRKPGAGRLEVSKTQYNYMNRQQQLQQMHQQRRADPLSPRRLLSQLAQAEAPKEPVGQVLTPSMLPRPTGNGRATQVPLLRAEPTATSGRIVAGTSSAVGANRCGKLIPRPLGGPRPK